MDVACGVGAFVSLKGIPKSVSPKRRVKCRQRVAKGMVDMVGCGGD